MKNIFCVNFTKVIESLIYRIYYGQTSEMFWYNTNLPCYLGKISYFDILWANLYSYAYGLYNFGKTIPIIHLSISQ